MKFRLFSVFMINIFLILLISCNSGKKQEEGEGTAQMKTGNLPAGQVLYTAPQGWVEEQPSSSMRKNQYRWPGVDGASDATLAVFFFPGTGGSVQQNLDRWYGQFKQPDGSATTDHVEKKQMMENGLPVTVVYVTGTYLESQSPMMMGGPVTEKPDYAMLAAIVETANGPWFFKATGPEKTVDHWRDSFYQFIKTFHIQSS